MWDFRSSWWEDDTALAYLVTEEARLLCAAGEDANLGDAGRALAAAAYHLSDPLEPEERAEILRAAEAHVGQLNGIEEVAAEDALILATEAAMGLEWVVGAPEPDRDLCAALQALRQAIVSLARSVGVKRAGELMLRPVL